MKRTKCAWFFVFTIMANTSWAYGGGSSSSKACDKPKFTDFVPAENAQVAASSTFSFTASKNTYPNTIKVTIKEQPTNIQVDKKNDGTFAVSGNLPATVKGYARITIAADAQSNCKGAGGWLVKITE